MDTKAESKIESSLKYFQVTDRLILRLKVLQHFIRALAEKQTLFKLYYLLSDTKHEGHFFQPLGIAPLVKSSALDKFRATPLDRLPEDAKQYLVPFLTHFVETKSKEVSTRNNLMTFHLHACNLRRFVDRKVLESEETMNMFPFSYPHCRNYIPIRMMEIDLQFTISKIPTLTSLLQWFFYCSVDQPAELSKEFAKRASIESDKNIPFFFQLTQLVLPLTVLKICPHLCLPYFMSIFTLNSTDKIRVNLFTEYPDTPLAKWAELSSEYQKDETLYQAWLSGERKQLDEILVVVFTITYTLYILSILNIYERTFDSANEGLPWVSHNIRAFRSRPYGYFTYKIPAHKAQDKSDRSYDALQKYVSNYGYLWMISDLSIFEIAPSRKEMETASTALGSTTQGLQKKEIEGVTAKRGILYFVLQSLIRQVQTWNRKKFRTTTSEIPRTTSGTYAEIEQELKYIVSKQEGTNEDDIVTLLQYLQTILTRPFGSSSHIYREILAHPIFLHWNERPGKIRQSKQEISIQLADKLSEFERNCSLQKQIESGIKDNAYLENMELDIFGWIPNTPLQLPCLLRFKSKWPKEHPITRNTDIGTEGTYIDDITRDVVEDAQRKANKLAEANKFWEVIRRISHLYLIQGYGDILPGREQWNPTIPRFAPGGLQCPSDCRDWAYLTVKHEESTKWYEFLENELLSRFFSINVDARNMTPEVKELSIEISRILREQDSTILTALSKRLEAYFTTLDPKFERHFFAPSLEFVKKQLEELVEERKKESEIEAQADFPQGLKDIQRKFSAPPKEGKTSSILHLYENPDFTIEVLEDLFPTLLRLLSLLPDRYRRKLLPTGEEFSPLDAKHDLRKRVNQIRDQLEEIELKQLMEFFPIPPGRPTWEELETKKRAQKELNCGKTPIPREQETKQQEVMPKYESAPVISAFPPSPPEQVWTPVQEREEKPLIEPAATPESPKPEEPGKQTLGFEPVSPSIPFPPREVPSEAVSQPSKIFEPVSPLSPPRFPFPAAEAPPAQVETFQPSSQISFPSPTIPSVEAAPLSGQGPSPEEGAQVLTPIPESSRTQETPIRYTHPLKLPPIRLPQDFINPFEYSMK